MPGQSGPIRGIVKDIVFAIALGLAGALFLFYSL
jgi:hypothetical protein